MNRNDSHLAKHFMKLKNNVLDKDGYLCQCCGLGEDLQIHHIMPVNLYPEQAFDVSNSITLCKTCHKEYHSRHGYKEDCNLQSYNEFQDIRRTLTGYYEKVNLSYGLINKPYHQKNKQDFKKWSMAILKSVYKHNGGYKEHHTLIEKIYEFYANHDGIVSGQSIDGFWQNFLHNSYDGAVSWTRLYNLGLKSKEPFLLINNDSNDILGAYTALRFELCNNDRALILDDIGKCQYITYAELSDLLDGKYDFFLLSEISEPIDMGSIRNKQFDEDKQESLYLEICDEKLESYCGGK